MNEDKVAENTIISEFDDLVSLLTQEQREKLGDLNNRFNDPELLANRVKDVLPEAIARRGKDDKVLAQILAPIVEEIIESSAQKDPETVAERLLPAIRRSVKLIVRDTFSDFITSLNQVLDHSLNFNWRIEAWRTGRPFGEIVLSKTLVYRVEQVFLIHKETGVLLNQVIIESEEARDGDLISSMLTAIQDFVRDSFKVDQSEILNNFQMGDLSVLIEQDDDVIVAAVVRGIVPTELDDDLQRTASLLQMRFRQELKNFTGDTLLFEEAEGPLKACLTANFVKPTSQPKPFLWVGFTIIATLLLIISFNEIVRGYKWSKAVNNLDQKAGIIITKEKRVWGNYQLSGLIDPLADDPQETLTAIGIAPKQVKYSWQPYYAFDKAILLRHAQQKLNPPNSVSLYLKGNTLKIVGKASSVWRETILETATSIVGIEKLDTVELYPIEKPNFYLQVKNLETKQINFLADSYILRAKQESKFDSIRHAIILLNQQGVSLGYDIEVLIIGHSVDIDCEHKTYELAKARAWQVLEEIRKNLPAENLNLRAVALKSEVAGHKTIQQNTVSFKVLVE